MTRREAYVCPTCGRVTGERRACVGSAAEPHAVRDPVRADELRESLTLEGPRIPLRRGKRR